MSPPALCWTVCVCVCICYFGRSIDNILQILFSQNYQSSFTPLWALASTRRSNQRTRRWVIRFFSHFAFRRVETVKTKEITTIRRAKNDPGHANRVNNSPGPLGRTLGRVILARLRTVGKSFAPRLRCRTLFNKRRSRCEKNANFPLVDRVSIANAIEVSAPRVAWQPDRLLQPFDCTCTNRMINNGGGCKLVWNFRN